MATSTSSIHSQSWGYFKKAWKGAALLILTLIGERLFNPMIDLASSPFTGESLSNNAVALGILGLIAIVAAGILAFLLAQRAYRWIKVANQAMREIGGKSEPTTQGRSPLVEQPSEKPVSGFSPEQERTLLKFGFHSLIQRHLTGIERRLDFQNPRPIEFKSWNETPENVRKRYINEPTTYETIEKIAKVLDTWNEAVNRANLLRVEPASGTIHLCIQSFRAYHDKLKELGFLLVDGV